MGISNVLLDHMKDFLENRFQKIVLNSQMSDSLPGHISKRDGNLRKKTFLPWVLKFHIDYYFQV